VGIANDPAHRTVAVKPVIAVPVRETLKWPLRPKT
jgi:hypothetical protein